MRRRKNRRPRFLDNARLHPRVRKNDGMTLGEAPAESAASHAAAGRALGYSEMRARILQIAFRDGSCNAAGLMAELDLTRGGIQGHVRALVAAGLLIPEQDPDPDRRAGGGSNRLRWHADAAAFETAVEEYRRNIRGAL